MEAVLLTLHLIVTIALVAVILLQRSEGGALGIGGGPAGMMTARGAGNLLTTVTKWLAAIFILNALALGWISANRDAGSGIVDQALEESQEEIDNGLPELPTIPDGGR